MAGTILQSKEPNIQLDKITLAALNGMLMVAMSRSETAMFASKQCV